MQLLHGDCLELMKDIPDGSIDAIITDPPYGTVKNIGNNDEINHGMKGKTEWDNALDIKIMFEECNRILKVNAPLILFSQEPYTSQLITNSHGNIPFSYRMIWLKDHFANALIAKKAPVSYFEDICVFFKKYDTQSLHPLRDWFYNEYINTNLTNSEITNLLQNGMAGHYFTKGIQFTFPTLNNFIKLQSTGFFKKNYDELKRIDNDFKKITKRKFNLSANKKYKSNVLEYKKDYDGFHPTQKPLKLMEDLIYTYTNEHNIVLDFTMGSGTTGLACKNLNRNFIGIEKDEKYFNIAKERIGE